MRRYFLEIAYNGATYHGWQIQKGDIPTVQLVINKALAIICRQEIETIGCGRTDTGVHGKQFFLHFDFTDLPSNFIYKLNAVLPKSVVAKSIQEVSNEAHARFAATSRTYHYYVHQSKDPFIHELSYYVPQKINVEAMNEAASYLLGKQDFTSFSKLHSSAYTNICTVTQAHWVRMDKDRLQFIITADRFLRNMVRAIVGTLIEVGKGKLTVEEFKAVIAQKNRGEAGKSVDGGALFLAEVTYDFIKA